MGTLWISFFLSVLVCGFIDARLVRKYREATIGPGFFDHALPFSFERLFDFTSRDPFFKSWWTPDLNFFADFPPLTVQPRVQVLCDDSKLTLLVDKTSFGLRWTEDEMQLGKGCYPNGELPYHYVFSYSFDQCGTTNTLQNGQGVWTNSLQLTHKTLPNMWHNPPSVHISCIQRRLHTNPSFAKALIDDRKGFNIQIVTPSWSNVGQLNTYKRGQVVDVQVSAELRPGQQLFIQSCFVSASPEPQTRPRHAVISNKGCATAEGSPYPVVNFLPSNRADTVAFSLNTSRVIPELYLHCSVLVSDHGITCGSKSCNYNVVQSRWEELGGDTAVCNCCSSKCKGLLKTLPGSKVIVSSELLVIEDVEQSPEIPLPELRSGSTQESDPTEEVKVKGGPAEDVLSGAFFSRRKLPSAPNGIVAVRQRPRSTQTLWLPGEQQRANNENGLDPKVEVEVHLLPSEAVYYKPVHQPSPVQQDSGDLSAWDLDLVTMVDAWPFPHKPDLAVVTEPVKKEQLGGVEKNGNEDVNLHIPVEMMNDLLLVGNAISEAADTVPADEPQRKKWLSDEHDFSQENLEMDPIIRSKVEFSTDKNGFKMLSYEEEVKRTGMEGKKGLERDGKKNPGLKGLYSTFLNLLRRMDKAE